MPFYTTTIWQSIPLFTTTILFFIKIISFFLKIVKETSAQKGPNSLIIFPIHIDREILNPDVHRIPKLRDFRMTLLLRQLADTEGRLLTSICQWV